MSETQSTEFEFGPVEFLLAGFEGDRAPVGVIDAIKDLIESDTVRLLDLVLVAHGSDGTVTATEIEDITDENGFGGIELEASGVAADEDIQEFAAQLPPGSSAALAVIEHVWAKTLASRLADAHGFVIHADRIPAPIVNAALAELVAEG